MNHDTIGGIVGAVLVGGYVLAYVVFKADQWWRSR